MKKGVAVFFVTFLIILSMTKVSAIEDINLPNITINPNNYLFYSIKRLTEKTITFIKFSQDSKADYYRDLTLKRLAELKYVVNQNLLGEIEKSSQRLSYEVGTLSDYVIRNKEELAGKKKAISDLLTNSKSLLATLRDKYPANSSYWMLIQHSINSIDLNLEKLK